MILQRSRHNLGRRRRAAVDEDDQRLTFGQIARSRIKALSLFRITPTGGYDFAPLKERIGNRDSLIQQAPGIVPKVNHITSELLAGYLIGDVGNRLFEA